VTGAVIGAGGALASLAFITREACALTSCAITDALGSAFNILVVVSKFIGCIDPSEFEWANSVGAISGV